MNIMASMFHFLCAQFFLPFNFVLFPFKNLLLCSFFIYRILLVCGDWSKTHDLITQTTRIWVKIFLLHKYFKFNIYVCFAIKDLSLVRRCLAWRNRWQKGVRENFGQIFLKVFNQSSKGNSWTCLGLNTHPSSSPWSRDEKLSCL